jgi:transporter family protein
VKERYDAHNAYGESTMPVDSWIIWALLAALFAALMTIFAKLGLENVDPDAAQYVRVIVVFLTMTLLIAVTGKWKLATIWDGRNWAYLVLSGLATFASWLCYFRALGEGPASKVAAIDNTFSK